MSACLMVAAVRRAAAAEPKEQGEKRAPFGAQVVDSK